MNLGGARTKRKGEARGSERRSEQVPPYTLRPHSFVPDCNYDLKMLHRNLPPLASCRKIFQIGFVLSQP